LDCIGYTQIAHFSLQPRIGCFQPFQPFNQGFHIARITGRMGWGCGKAGQYGQAGRDCRFHRKSRLSKESELSAPFARAAVKGQLP
jgi:hypothetical protein